MLCVDCGNLLSDNVSHEIMKKDKKLIEQKYDKEKEINKLRNEVLKIEEQMINGKGEEGV